MERVCPVTAVSRIANDNELEVSSIARLMEIVQQ